MQGLLHDLGAGGPLQQGLVKLVAVHLDIQRSSMHSPGSCTIWWGLIEGKGDDAFTGAPAQASDPEPAAPVPPPESRVWLKELVELEGFGFGEVRAGGGMATSPRATGFALGIEPGEFIQGPDVAALERLGVSPRPRSSRFRLRGTGCSRLGCTG